MWHGGLGYGYSGGAARAGTRLSIETTTAYYFSVGLGLDSELASVSTPMPKTTSDIGHMG